MSLWRIGCLFICMLCFCGMVNAQNDAACPALTAGLKPIPSQDEPIPVSITIYVIDVERVLTVEHTFVIDFILGIRWHDPRIQAPQGGQCVYPVDKIWHPQLHILNIRDLTAQLPNTVVVDDEGIVLQRQRYHGELSADFDLRHFPFDEQRLAIQLVSFDYGPDTIALTLDTLRTGRAKFFTALGWEIGPGEVIIDVATTEAAHMPGMSQDFASFEYLFLAKRKVSFYVWKVIFPLSIIIFMSWAVFWVNPRQVAVQITVAATAILTLVAFLFTVAALLPEVSYLTYLDYFVFAGLVLVFAAFIEALVTCRLATLGYEDVACKIDVVARFAFPIAFLLGVLALIIVAVDF